MTVAVVLFNRVLRLADHPALATALRRADAVVPLFVIEPAIVEGPFGAPNRVAFLAETLIELRDGLRMLGGDLVIRVGEAHREAVRVAMELGATTIHYSADVTAHAARRQRRLAEAAAAAGIEVVAHPGIGVIDAGAVTPSGGGDHFKVFTPYLRAWSALPRRPLAARPKRVALPTGVEVGPAIETVLADRRGQATSPQRAAGGEEQARGRLHHWLQAGGLGGYADGHDDLAGDRTSHLAAALHFGCLSPLELTSRFAAPDAPEGAAAFVRQLCWRDFYHQVTAAFPAIAHADYRTRHDVWIDDAATIAAWKAGRTGYPIVDAGLRQLRAEGFMHNRARMITASFLTKNLGVDWRVGAEHFLYWLTDGDIAQNSANWQWTAGTGNDTRPNRLFNPLRQAERFDPAGAYVRRYVPELADIEGAAVHQPWKLAAGRRPTDYPPPLVDLDHSAAAFKARRDGQQALPW